MTPTKTAGAVASFNPTHRRRNSTIAASVPPVAFARWMAMMSLSLISITEPYTAGLKIRVNGVPRVRCRSNALIGLVKLPFSAIILPIIIDVEAQCRHKIEHCCPESSHLWTRAHPSEPVGIKAKIIPYRCPFFRHTVRGISSKCRIDLQDSNYYVAET